MIQQVRIGKAARFLGVCTKTIRRWDRAGKIQCTRTIGGHRRITLIEIERIKGQIKPVKGLSRTSAIYSRVSSHEQKQKGDLHRQLQVALNHCHEQKEKKQPLIFTDVASGLNTKRRGLKKLCQAIEEGTIDRVIVTYPDRLTRFGFKYLEQYFQSHGTEITVINDTRAQSMEEELVKDLIAIITSFSGRIHGLRSHRNKRGIRKG